MNQCNILTTCLDRRLGPAPARVGFNEAHYDLTTIKDHWVVLSSVAMVFRRTGRLISPPASSRDRQLLQLLPASRWTEIELQSVAFQVEMCLFISSASHWASWAISCIERGGRESSESTAGK
jgi:hypothetical protein